MRESAAVIAIVVGMASHADERVARADAGEGWARSSEPALVVEGAPARRARTVEPVSDGVPAGWRAIRDRETGVVLRLWGGHVEAPGAVRDPGVAERAARAFVAQHVELLAPGSRIEDLVAEANRLDEGVRTVVLRQTWRGLRVVGGYVHVVFARDRLFVAGSEALPHVAPVRAGGARAGRAGMERAEAWLRRETGRPQVAVRAMGERVVLPIVRSGAIEYRIAEVLEARAPDPAGRWDVYVDGDGAPIARERRVWGATATLRFDVGDRYPNGTRSPHAAASASVSVDGAAATTGADGGFAWAGTAPAVVAPSASGTRVQVTNAAGPPATAQLTAQPDQPLDWSLAGDELGDAQLAAYVFGMIGKAEGRRMQPGLAWLDRPLTIGVNYGGACNAVSTGDGIYFYRAGAGCENTARLADVVLHEFAHSYHFQSSMFPMSAIEPALAEGVADFFAAHVTGDPGVGRGFDGTDQPVRQLDPVGYERAYPVDIAEDPHLTGRIVGGALWDLRQGLIARLGPDEGRRVIEQIFVGVLRRASDLPSSYVAALAADDDDGDLGNGTPHGCEIERAFGRHGLAGPGFRTTTVGPVVVSGLEVSVAADVPVGTACAPPRVTGVTLTWRPGDGPEGQVAMTEDGASWRGAIPPQAEGTVVSYQVAARFDDGELVILPDNPADRWYQLLAGDAAPIWCERFDADPRWRVMGARVWQWGAPQGSAGDPGAAFTGAAVLGTVLDGAYGPQLSSVIEAPPVDVSGYERVHLQLRRWLTVEDAAHDKASITIDGVPVWTNAAGEGGTLDHVDREWRMVDLDVTPQRSDAMVVGWTLATDGSVERGGWNLDDVCLVGLGKLPRCGDAIVDDGEACDDGNLEDGDGCSAACEDEAGGCCRAGTGPTGPLALALGLGLGLGRRRRRRAASPRP